MFPFFPTKTLSRNQVLPCAYEFYEANSLPDRKEASKQLESSSLRAIIAMLVL